MLSHGHSGDAQPLGQLRRGERSLRLKKLDYRSPRLSVTRLFSSSAHNLFLKIFLDKVKTPSYPGFLKIIL